METLHVWIGNVCQPIKTSIGMNNNKSTQPNPL